jgi:hypothetical protein
MFPPRTRNAVARPSHTEMRERVGRVARLGVISFAISWYRSSFRLTGKYNHQIIDADIPMNANQIVPGHFQFPVCP